MAAPPGGGGPAGAAARPSRGKKLGISITIPNSRGELPGTGYEITAAGTLIDYDSGVAVSTRGYRVRMKADPTGTLDYESCSMEGVTEGNWRVIGTLGAGNSGAIVHLAQHADTHELMAVKAMYLSLEDEPRRRIVRELKLLHETNTCPQIVRFLGAYRVENYVHVCMEFCDLNSLDRLLKHVGHLDERPIRYVAREVLTAIAFLKAHSIMHRDIKPSNILLNSRGEVKLCDLGISVQLQASVALSHVGTAMYLAPERIASEAPYDVRADIWSLGVTIVELADGRCPYESARTVFAAMDLILNCAEPKLAPERAAETSPEMHEFIAWCLHKSVGERPYPNVLLGHAWLDTDRSFSMVAWLESRLTASYRAALTPHEHEHDAAAAAAARAGPTTGPSAGPSASDHPSSVSQATVPAAPAAPAAPAVPAVATASAARADAVAGSHDHSQSHSHSHSQSHSHSHGDHNDVGLKSAVGTAAGLSRVGAAAGEPAAAATTAAATAATAATAARTSAPVSISLHAPHDASGAVSPHALGASPRLATIGTAPFGGMGSPPRVLHIPPRRE